MMVQTKNKCWTLKPEGSQQRAWFSLAPMHMTNRVVGIDQPYRNPPSKSSNGQPNQGLLQANFDLKAVTTSSFEMKLLDCPQPYPKVSK